MGIGAVRAGGALKSTGARRTVKVGSVQKARIDNSVKQLHTNGPVGNPISRLGSISERAALAGNRLQAPQKKEGGVENEDEFQGGVDWSDPVTRAEIKHEENVRAMEIEKRQVMIRRLPKEFSYKKPAAGPGFYLILLITAAKDLLSIIIKIIEIFFAVTVVGGIIIWVIASLMDVFVFICSTFYFFMNDIPLGGKKAKIQLFGFLIELVPILGLLPTETIALIWVRIEVNRDAKKKAIEEMNDKIALLQAQIVELQNDGEEAALEYAN